MLPNSQLHLLRQIEQRRKYRNWVLALQIAMVVFFADQISKTWITGHLAVGQAKPVLGQSYVEVTRLPTRGLVAERLGESASWVQTLVRFLPAVVLGLLAIALLLRLPEAAFGELCAFAFAMSGTASNVVGLWFSQAIVETVRVNFGAAYLVFNLADVATILGGVVLLRRLTSTLFAEARWLVTRQTG
jgi:lipoprotein signal peptidase